MSILKTNSALGAFKSVSEWLSKHTHLNLDKDNPKRDVVLKDDGYDLSSKHLGEYSWDSKRLYFEPTDIGKCDSLGSEQITTSHVSISIPDCFSKSFLDRIESIYIGSPSSHIYFHVGWADFDPKDLMNLPKMSNLKEIDCYAPVSKEDMSDFVQQMCEGAKHLAPYARVEIGTYTRDKLILTKYSDEIRRKLKNIEIDKVTHLVIHEDYLRHHQASRYLSQGYLKSIDIISDGTDSHERSEVIEICNSDLDFVNVPNHFDLILRNCKVGNIDKIVKRPIQDVLVKTVIDDRTRIKSGLGVDPITSTAIDMFGNCIHKGDIVVHGGKDGIIEFSEVLEVEEENLRVYGSNDLLSFDQYENSYKLKGRLCTTIKDRACWKIPKSFFDQSNRNGFMEDIIETSKE